MTRNNWDCIIVTLGSKKQVELCSPLAERCSQKYGCSIKLIYDSESFRASSGGAVLAALNSISPEIEADKKKILIVNSGGMSKRAINYALRGKAFADIAVDNHGEPLTLLDTIITNLSLLPDKFDAGLVVCCSDIPVKIDNAECSFETSVGFCIPCDLKTASRHGVMVADSDGFLAEYLHKQPQHVLNEKCYSLPDGALLDTGLTYFSPDVVESLLAMATGKNSLLDRLISEKKELSLYSDIISPMASQSKGSGEIYDSLHGKKIKVCRLDTEFTHFGTVREAVENIKKAQSEKDGFSCFNSFVSNDSIIADGTVIDNAEIENGCVIGSNCFISDVLLKNVTVPDNKSVCGIKLNDGSYVTIVSDIDENPKNCGKSGTQLWDEPRFYKGLSFTESYNLFADKNVHCNKVSMADCIENADYHFCAKRQKYLKEMCGITEFEPYSKLRREIVSSFFSSGKEVGKYECVRDSVCIRLPLRINFSGTWTDCMPYCTDNGGAVINAAITVDGTKPACVTAEKLEDRRIELCCSDSGKSICIDDIKRIDYIDSFDTFSLHKAALKIIGFNKDTKLPSGFRLTTGVSGVMKGSGLGTSSTLLAGCFKALGSLFGIEYGNDEIIKMTFAAEQLMATGGGWQDQAATLSDGIKIVSSVPGIEQNVSIKPLNISEGFAHQLNDRLALISTCQRHYGRFVVSDVMRRYMQNESSSVSSLKALFELNSDVEKSLSRESISDFSACVNKQWDLLKKLSPLITNEEIDAIVDAGKPLCDAMCICGAGAGGYLLAIMKESITIGMLREQLGKITDEVKNIEIII